MTKTNPRKTALVTGITGQDGPYVAQMLLEEQGFERVVGLARRTSDDKPEQRLRLPEMQAYLRDGRLVIDLGDMLDLHSLVTVLDRHEPGYIFNLAAQSHVGKSFFVPEVTIATSINGVLNLLKAVAMTDTDTRMYQASTSEMFGNMPAPQNEQTPLRAVSPYGVGKISAHFLMQMARNRSSDPLWACSGILFNHESPYRGENFVTRKISKAVALWADGGRVPLKLGYLDSKRDWGYAYDYARAMWLIINQQVSDPRDLQDYVVATGETHTVREFVIEAFRAAGRMSTLKEPELEWRGSAENEQLLVNGTVMVEINPEFYRPNELTQLLGDPAKIKAELGWEPSVRFSELVEMMVEADIRRLIG